MYCSKCGTQNPDQAKFCGTCGAILTPAPPAPTEFQEQIMPKTSGMAIAALILGILSFFLGIFTGLPALILGIIALVKIEKSGGKITGKGFAIAGIITPVFSFVLMLAIVMPALFRVRQIAFRMVCGTNLSGIGKAMLIYANDYEDELPRSGGTNSTWAARIPDWQALNRFGAYGVAANGTGGTANISSCFYLLVKYAELTPKSFICKGDTGATEFRPYQEGAGSRHMIDLWDFGPEPSKHCSYSYHQPFGKFPLTTSSEPGMAVAADRNPLQDSPAATAKSWPSIYDPDGDRKAVRYGNAIAHEEEVQNVLFLDCHVGQEKVPFCGINDDNIYTFWDGGDIRIGASPMIGSQPQNRLDSLLVHDVP